MPKGYMGALVLLLDKNCLKNKTRTLTNFQLTRLAPRVLKGKTIKLPV